MIKSFARALSPSETNFSFLLCHMLIATTTESFHSQEKSTIFVKLIVSWVQIYSSRENRKSLNLFWVVSLLCVVVFPLLKHKIFS